MPLNLPAEAVAAEKRYRDASSIPAKIATLEEFISAIPKHKGTDRLRADLRKKLSKLKSASQSKKGASKQESVFHINKEGAGQVLVVGPTNVGKSALVAAMTNASPQVAPVPFTTWTPTPGMMSFENVQIQLVDTPPLDRDFVEPQLLDLIRRSDLVLLVVDLLTHPIQQLEDSVAFLAEHRIVPRRLQERRAEGQGMVFVPLLVLTNKADDQDSQELYEICRELLDEDWPMMPVSATSGRNLERLKQTVFERLGVMRVYSKPPGQEPNFDAPFVLQKGSNVAEFAAQVHRDFYDKLKTARVWGAGVYDGQMVGRDHVLCDGDVVELRL